MTVASSGPGIRGFFAMPHGASTIVPMVFATAALALALTALLVEDFVSVQGWARYVDITFNTNTTIDIVTVDEDGQETVTTRNPVESYDEDLEYFEYYYGLTRSNRAGLIEHDFFDVGYIEDPEEDKRTINFWKASAALASASVIIGGMAMAFSYTLTCIAFSRAYRILLSVAFFICFLFNMLTLIVFSSDACKADWCESDDPDYPTRSDVNEQLLNGVPRDDECRDGCAVGAGAGAAIGASLLWLVCGIVVSCVLSPVDKEVHIVQQEPNETEPLKESGPLTDASFANGTRVRINGLKSSSHFNNKDAIIIQFLQEEGRYMVELVDTKEMINLKPVNLIAVRDIQEPVTRGRHEEIAEPEAQDYSINQYAEPPRQTMPNRSRSGFADDGITSLPPPVHQAAEEGYKEVLVD